MGGRESIGERLGSWPPAVERLLKVIGGLADREVVQVFAVGGMVRDQLLGRDVTDIDILVLGDGIAFARKVASGVGKVLAFDRFGTASWYSQGQKVESATARKEQYPSDSRKPEVEWGSLEDDLRRRDFTVNALAMGLNGEMSGRLIDPFDGLGDLEKKILRTPTDPGRTFSEDPLRMLRGVRFACQLGFAIHQDALQAIHETKGRLSIVSQERIADEFLKIMATPKPSVGLKLMYITGLLDVIFPEVAALKGVEERDGQYHKDIFEHTLMVVDNLASSSDNSHLRLAGLFHDIAKPRVKRFIKGKGWTFHGHEEVGARMLEGLAYRLRLPRSFLNYGQKLIRLHMRPIHLTDEGVTDSAIRRLLVQAGDDIDELLTLCRADITSGNPKRVARHLANFDRVVRRMGEIEEKDRLRAFQSPVRGDEIMDVCVIPPGPNVGRLKKAIEEAILDGKIPNEHDAALQYLLEIKDDILGTEDKSESSEPKKRGKEQAVGVQK